MDISEQAEGTKEEKRLREIISLVNDNFEGKLWKIKGLWSFLKRNWINFFSFGFYFVVIVFLLSIIAELSQALTSSLPQFTSETALSLSLALIASLVAILNFSINISNITKSEKLNADVITDNCDKMKKNVKDDELPLLKALIIMKSKHPEIDLKTFLERPGELLSRERLFEILYLQKN